MFYVYVYLNKLKPGDFKYGDINFEYEPFYVGKGKLNRYLYHLKKVKNESNYKPSAKFDIIKENLKNNVEPVILKFDGLSEDESLNKEKYFINIIGRLDLGKGPLTNRNDGGQKPQDNFHHTKESKIKISISGKKRKPEERYTLISPDDLVYENVKLSIFCKDNNLDYQKMRKSSNKGRIKPIRITSIKQSKKETINCVGWSVINKKLFKVNSKKIKYMFIKPDGEKIEILTGDMIKEVCDKFNLDQRTLRYYKNKGKIEIKNKKQSKIETINCTGWQFIVLN